jgi:hypothetical protein
VIGVPSIFKEISKETVLVRVIPTFTSRVDENTGDRLARLAKRLRLFCYSVKYGILLFGILFIYYETIK